MNINSRKWIYAALFAALTCVATMAIRIPTPGTGGYIHPGDGIVIISGVLLGPWWGLAAAGLGSALADVIGGYFIYVPATFIVKGAVALVAGFISRSLRKRAARSRLLPVILGGVADIVFVVGGYFLWEIPLYGANVAALSVVANLIQSGSGLVIGVILYPILIQVPDIRKLSLS